MNQAVTDYIEALNTKPKQEWQAQVCARLREVVLDSIPDVEEKIQYSKPHYRKNGNYVAVIGTAKGWVTFTIFNAESLQAPEGFFEDGPPERKTIKIFNKDQVVDYDLVAKLLQQAANA